MTRKLWTDDEIWRLIALHADTSNASLARTFGRTYTSICAMASVLGLQKSAEYLSGIAHRTGAVQAGIAYRFPKGHVPANKGLRRPGWAPGRMKETQFKKGQFPFNRDPEFYVLGALRINSDGYIDIRVSFEPGANGWRGLHRVLWEDRHGPIPAGYVVAFKDGDPLNCWHDNFELRSRKDHMLRNSIQNLPAPLKSTIRTLGVLRRIVNRRTRDEKQDRQSA